MKTENLSIGLRALYHAIEWLTVFLILLIFAVQIITPLYAVKVGRADSFLQQLQWLPAVPPRCACPGRDAGSGGQHPEQVLP